MTDKPQIDEQDPLPESNWFWRRVFTIATISALLAFIWFFVEDIASIALKNESETAVKGLVDIVKFLLVLVGLGQAYYLIAPSAEQLARIIQSAASLRSGVTFRREDERPARTWFGERKPSDKSGETFTPSEDDLAGLDEENQPRRE